MIVIGGGPAGSATALALARAGRAVKVLERPLYERHRAGEVLPPEVWRPLTDLGVWDRFLADGHLASPGIAIAWGRPDLHSHDFIANPCGTGWHVDRRRFDAMLAEAAEAAGADILRGAKPTRWAQHRDGTWRVEILTGRRSWEIHADMLIDASGRSAWLARRLGGHRIVYDRLIGLIGLIPGEAGSSCHDRRTLIEAVECGWWYSALLADGRHVAAFMTDADSLPAGSAARSAFWRRWLRQAPHTQARLGAVPSGAGVRVVPACNVSLEDVAGPGWLAVGDAALSLDPLSGQGVMWALESALKAALAVDSSLDGDRAAITDYAGRVAVDSAHYYRTRAEVYGEERRWPASAFWRRRHAADERMLQDSRSPSGSDC